MDADHSSFDNDELPEFIKDGATIFAQDKQNAWTKALAGKPEKFDFQKSFFQNDIILLNGNHFEAKNLLVFIDKTKFTSLEKRKNQLTNVLAFIEIDEDVKLPQFIHDEINEIENVPTFSIDQQEEIASFVEKWYQDRIPKLNALILAGGESSRMGKSKALLNYHGIEQYKWLEKMLKLHVEQVFLSQRNNQEFETDLPIIEDSFLNLGPMGAILSAMREQPNAAWLVLACDLPFLDGETVELLIKNRSAKHVATAFKNEKTGFAEPLVAIWEPKAYQQLLHFLALGYSCPRKVLINTDTNLIACGNPEKLANVNTPEEFEAAKRILDGTQV
ncbi:MAG: NTP transferase domain-containing protein [Flavobacteriales bacterium]|nr:NTP transferase domain-containing protein [Flavobacteriales bacterium]